ncbi:Fic family protein [Roseovarius sp. MMSF_3305]|uniref:Fic family protein n=1 Tax=Roseovarius sp. MMSF_3305 TaxID=3046697 RepID=UPI00273D1439|nr:Fic family protein [Roseovarius sp. MMSF_3305]
MKQAILFLQCIAILAIKLVVSTQRDTTLFMTTAQTLVINNTTYDCSKAVEYHYGRFPPEPIDLPMVFEALTSALQNLTRYDEQLKHLQNSELLLAPLRQRDAVVSSRMEGTISTLEEVLRLEASENARRTEGTARNETLEVALYARALSQAEDQIRSGHPISEMLIKNAHRTLLSAGRGAKQRPGEYKEEQNYIGDKAQRRVDFIPISPEDLPDGMRRFIDFIRNDKQHHLIRTAIAHAEFEALHPFEDGNGRVGRMLIPLMLWEYEILSAPHFFVSDYFERNKDSYIQRMRDISDSNSWSAWCSFFLSGLSAQAEKNMDTVGKIQTHYEATRERFREVLRSQYFHSAVDYVFNSPVFWNNHFVEVADGPKSTLRNFTPRLVQEGLLDTIVPPSGRAPGLYAYSSLLRILEDDT